MLWLFIMINNWKIQNSVFKYFSRQSCFSGKCQINRCVCINSVGLLYFLTLYYCLKSILDSADKTYSLPMAGECDTSDLWSGMVATVSQSSVPQLMQTCVVVADVCWSSQCGQGAGSQPLFWVSQWDIVQQAALHCLTGHQCLEVTLWAQSVLQRHHTPQTECPYCLSFPEVEVILNWNDLKAEICDVLSDTPLWGESRGCFLVCFSNLSSEGLTGRRKGWEVSALSMCPDSPVPTDQKSSRNCPCT